MKPKSPVAVRLVGTLGAVVSPPPVNVTVTKGPRSPRLLTARTLNVYSTPSTRGDISAVVSVVVVDAYSESAVGFH